MTMSFVPRFAPDPSCHASRECANPAAEYISFTSTNAGVSYGGMFMPATTFRRVCTPCADAMPVLLSRQPLSSAVKA